MQIERPKIDGEREDDSGVRNEKWQGIEVRPDVKKENNRGEANSGV